MLSTTPVCFFVSSLDPAAIKSSLRTTVVVHRLLQYKATCQLCHPFEEYSYSSVLHVLSTFFDYSSGTPNNSRAGPV